jgi:hypothetical protein
VIARFGARAHGVAVDVPSEAPMGAGPGHGPLPLPGRSMRRATARPVRSTRIGPRTRAPLPVLPLATAVGDGLRDASLP